MSVTVGEGRYPVPGHIERGCVECVRRAANADTARILEITAEAGMTISFGRSEAMMVGRHRLDDLMLVRGATRDLDSVRLRFKPEAPEHGTAFMGGRL